MARRTRPGHTADGDVRAAAGTPPDDPLDAAWTALTHSFPAAEHPVTDRALRTIADFWLEEDDDWEVFHPGFHPDFDPELNAAVALARRSGWQPQSWPDDALRFVDAGLAPQLMTLVVANRRRAPAGLEREHPGALVLDLTSKGPEPWVAFSPFYPHGDIPVPFTPGVTSQTVEGIWQALKVFESVGVDPSKLVVSSMKGIKRTFRRYGRVRGHREGLEGERLLPYVEHVAASTCRAIDGCSSTRSRG